MKRSILFACVCASLLAASVASAGSTTSDQHARNEAAKQCAAQKKADPVAFRAVWGDHAMRNCIKATGPQTSDQLKNAAKECKAERQADPATFQQTYGTGKDALGKCVSAKVKGDRQDAVAAFKSAAKDCRAERQADPQGFQQTYGSSSSKGRNAFGKCVSSKVGKGHA